MPLKDFLMKDLQWTQKPLCICGITKCGTWKGSWGIFSNQIICQARKLTAWEFVGCSQTILFKLRLKHKFPDSLFSPLSAPSQCQCSSFPGAPCLSVDRETEGVCGTPGVISQHRRSRGSDGWSSSTLLPLPLVAIEDRSSHSIPGMMLPLRSPAFSLPQQPRWNIHALQFNQTIWWEFLNLIAWKFSSSERKGEREKEKLNWSINQSRT